VHDSETIEMVATALKGMYKKKTHFLADMEKELGMAIPASVTYKNAVELWISDLFNRFAANAT